MTSKDVRLLNAGQVEGLVQSCLAERLQQGRSGIPYIQQLPPQKKCVPLGFGLGTAAGFDDAVALLRQAGIERREFADPAWRARLGEKLIPPHPAVLSPARDGAAKAAFRAGYHDIFRAVFAAVGIPKAGAEQSPAATKAELERLAKEAADKGWR